MPTYSYICTKCRTRSERVIPLRLFDAEADQQQCGCGQPLQRQSFTPEDAPTFIGRQKPGSKLRPRVRGFDKGGFMRGRVENDGCADPLERKLIKENAARLGVNVSGGFYVPGLARYVGDPNAVCHSRSDVFAKAQDQGVNLRGPGMDFQPPVRDEEYAKAEDEHCGPSAEGVQLDVARELHAKGAKTTTPKEIRDLTEKYQHKFSRRPVNKTAPDLKSVLGDMRLSDCKVVP